MNKFLVAAMCVLFASQSMVLAETPAKIRWESSTSDAFDKAKAAKKLLVVYYYRDRADELNFEQAMEVTMARAVERKVFNQSGFQAYADRAVFVRRPISGLKPNSFDAQILRELKIDNFPTLVVFDIAGEEIFSRGQITGSPEPEVYLNVLSKIFEKGTSPTVDRPEPTPPSTPDDFVPPSPFGPDGRLKTYSEFQSIIDSSR